jgi:hypothetical protein
VNKSAKVVLVTGMFGPLLTMHLRVKPKEKKSGTALGSGRRTPPRALVAAAGRARTQEALIPPTRNAHRDTNETPERLRFHKPLLALLFPQAASL